MGLSSPSIRFFYFFVFFFLFFFLLFFCYFFVIFLLLFEKREGEEGGEGKRERNLKEREVVSILKLDKLVLCVWRETVDKPIFCGCCC